MFVLARLLFELQCLIQGHEWHSPDDRTVYCLNCARTR
jgi:hypothetical protein